MERLKTLMDMTKTLRKGEYVGDVAVLKITLFEEEEGENQYTDQVLKLRDLNFTYLDLSALLQHPEESFGRAFYEFMLRNNLKPFNFSPRVQELYTRFPVTTRYARIHDMVHTLLGFEADLAGELGVYAFVYQQQYSRFLVRAYKTGRIVTRLMKPWAYRHFAQTEELGLKLAVGARPLIIERLEDYLPLPLSEVRSQLIPAYFEHQR